MRKRDINFGDEVYCSCKDLFAAFPSQRTHLLMTHARRIKNNFLPGTPYSFFEKKAKRFERNKSNTGKEIYKLYKEAELQMRELS